MDSLINHYTANRKVRNDDAYSPGGRIGLRPDRATLPYCHRAREAFPGVPIIAGGVEASLRRLAHYDYWSDTVRRSILLDCKADLVVYGMGEKAIVEIARRLAAGQTVRDLRDMRGVAYALGASESPRQPARERSGMPAPGSRRRARDCDRSAQLRGGQGRQAGLRRGDAAHPRQHQPLQRQDAGAVSTTARRSWSTRRALPLSAGGDGPRSTTCRTRAGRTRRTPSRSPPTR